MKKVLFVATVTIHINTFHIPYLKMLKEQGYEVHVASNGNEKIEYCDKHFNLPFERFPLKKNNIKVFKELRKIIEENNYEFVHCHTPVGGAITRLAAKKARKKGTRIIYTAHGFHFFKGAPLLNWLIYYPIEKVLAKYTDTLITINQEDYDRAKNHFKIKQIELVHGVGVDKSKFDFEMSEEEKQELRRTLKVEKSHIILTYVAELNKNKNQILLINVLKELLKTNVDFRLILVGDGSSRKYYEDYIKRNNLQKYMRVLGKRKDVPQILKISDIYLASSIREGLGINIIEAMFEDLPIIATENRGHREIILNGINGFMINKFDGYVDFSKKIELLTNDIELRKKFVSNSRQMVNKFELKSIKNTMKKIYFNN